MSGQHPYGGGLPQLSDDDPEFSRIRYLIQLGLRSTSVDVISISLLNSRQTRTKFEHAYQGQVVLDSFVNTRELPEANSIQNIISRNGTFAFPNEEPCMAFPTGNVRLPLELQELGSGDRRQMHEVLYCRAAVNHALVLERDKLHTTNNTIPEGFDSIKIHEPDGEVIDSDPDPDYYYHEYLLGDEKRVLPLFLVSFLFDPDADKRKRNPICEQCEINAATVYCLQDNAKLCDPCDLELHSKSKVLEKHSRVDINQVQGNLTLSRCKEHPEMPVQFYDPVGYKPVCVHCKMMGSHSKGEYANHPLIPINDAYSENMTRLQQERENVERKQKHIQAQLGNVDERLKQVHNNANMVEKQLREIMNRVIAKLQTETRAKLHLLLSDETELRRQMHYYEWLEVFLRYQKDVLDPVEFLNSFRCHNSLLQAAPSEIIETSPIIMNDMVVEGDVDVLSLPASQAANFKGHRNNEFMMGSRSRANIHSAPYNDLDSSSVHSMSTQRISNRPSIPRGQIR